MNSLVTTHKQTSGRRILTMTTFGYTQIQVSLNSFEKLTWNYLKHLWHGVNCQVYPKPFTTMLKLVYSCQLTIKLHIV